MCLCLCACVSQSFFIKKNACMGLCLHAYLCTCTLNICTSVCMCSFMLSVCSSGCGGAPEACEPAGHLVANKAFCIDGVDPCACHAAENLRVLAIAPVSTHILDGQSVNLATWQNSITFTLSSAPVFGGCFTSLMPSGLLRENTIFLTCAKISDTVMKRSCMGSNTTPCMHAPCHAMPISTIERAYFRIALCSHS